MISLTEMSGLAAALVKADQEVEKVEEKLKKTKEQARFLREESIPLAMAELGLERIKLESGQEITVEQVIYASIPKKHQFEAFNWLEANGFAGLIKVDVSAKFGRSEAKEAEALFGELEERGLASNLKQSVHPQTLKAFIREQVAEGNPIPMDLFGARPVMTAKIK